MRVLVPDVLKQMSFYSTPQVDAQVSDRNASSSAEATNESQSTSEKKGKASDSSRTIDSAILDALKNPNWRLTGALQASNTADLSAFKVM